ncbi:hypothetical protein PoB_002265000 [Plakobranchus ocellatus]|uniref:Uncharacterized protein n=1 Tax=Plakobranchus ocellatus TaxID=259542 RepID=A0AAV3ZNI5_9GAST|nr:hypothetical protein PoB_002265000 [Plakobranchus ocellatus]
MTVYTIELSSLILISAYLAGLVTSLTELDGQSKTSALFPWLDLRQSDVNIQNGGLLSRARRSTNDTDSGSSRNIWEEIELAPYLQMIVDSFPIVPTFVILL